MDEERKTGKTLTYYKVCLRSFRFQEVHVKSLEVIVRILGPALHHKRAGKFTQRDHELANVD